MVFKKITSVLLAASMFVFSQADPVYAGIRDKASDMDLNEYTAEAVSEPGESGQEVSSSFEEMIEDAEAELEKRRRAAYEAAEAAKAEAAAAAQAKAEAAALEAMLASAEYLGRFTLTAYCHCAACCSVAGNATASGVMPTTGHTVAMGGVPFGTKLLINGTVYTVEDRGTPYGHVDIFMDSHEEALRFGMSSADVYLVHE